MKPVVPILNNDKYKLLQQFDRLERALRDGQLFFKSPRGHFLKVERVGEWDGKPHNPLQIPVSVEDRGRITIMPGTVIGFYVQPAYDKPTGPRGRPSLDKLVLEPVQQRTYGLTDEAFKKVERACQKFGAKRAAVMRKTISTALDGNLLTGDRIKGNWPQMERHVCVYGAVSLHERIAKLADEHNVAAWRVVNAAFMLLP
jgi:hypothetical protein